MGFTRRSLILGSAASAGALGLAACGGGSKSGSGSDSGSGSGAGVTANGTEPQNPLIPTHTNEVGGGRVVSSIFSTPTCFDAKGQVQMDLAESVESDDKQKWTIKLKKDLKFSDGSPIVAKNFVDAWNYGAFAGNAQNAQSFFEPIKGFADVSKEGASVKEMSGLKAVDDQTITVELTSVQSDFPIRLGYSAFAPVPESALKDMKAFGQKPVGSGPYKLDSWSHDQKIVLSKNEHYTGPRAAKNDALTFTIYESNDTAYADLQSGDLDVLDQIPGSAIQKFQQELGDRAVNKEGALFQSFTMMQNDPNFSGEAGKLRRQALSMAVDRAQICKAIFNGTRTPATDFVAPVIDGGGAKDIPGNEVLKTDVAKAKELWKRAESMTPFKGKFTLAYNADGPHKEWVEAVCNSIKNNLGIDAEPKPFPTFGEFRKLVQSGKMTGGFRTGWQADYPSAFNFLGPLYSSAAADGKGSNDGNYKNPEFDKLLAEGLAAADTKAANEKYHAAEAILMKDLPAIPLWYQNTLGGYSDQVKNVEFGWDTVPLYYKITK